MKIRPADINNESATNGYVLTLSGGVAVWTVAAGGVTNLDGLSDVAVSSPSTGQTLRYNGTNFVNTQLAAGDIGSFNEAVDDRVAALLVAGANITLTYDDVANTLSLDASVPPSNSISDGGNASVSVDTGGVGVSGTSGDWYYLPNTLGADGQVLAITDYTTNTTGWVDPGSGGSGGIASVQSDTTPALGGDLDVNGHKLVNNTTGGIILQNDSVTLETAAGTVSFALNTVGVALTGGSLYMPSSSNVYLNGGTGTSNVALSKGAGDALYQPLGSYAPASGSANYQATSSQLTAVAGAAWSAGTQILSLTAANTVTLKTVGSATGNILDKASGDSLYKPKDPVIYTASVTGATTVDCTGYDVLKLTLTGNLTLTLSNIVDGKTYKILLIQDGTGGRTVTLNSQFKFGTDVTEYTASTAASKTDDMGVWIVGTNVHVIGVAKGY